MFRGLAAVAIGRAAPRARGATDAAGLTMLAAAGLSITPEAAPKKEVIFGEGEHRYRVVEGRGELPPGYRSRDGAAV